MRGIDHPIRHCKRDRMITYTCQIAAPPIAAGVALDIGFYAFDDDQPVRVHGENRISCPFAGQPPVCGKLT
ncbi:hypothetical protein D3C73_744730 [compost metagenome]